MIETGRLCNINFARCACHLFTEERLKYQTIAISALVFALTACGGAGDSSTDSLAATYRFITPTAGAKNVFAVTLVDNLNNTLNRTIVESVSTVNADGSFVTMTSDPSNNSVFSGSVDHTVYPTATSYNSSAQETQTVVTPPNGSPTTCTFSPYGAGAPSPLQAGQAWSLMYTESCGGGGSITNTQSGTYVGTESIAVPAGTFTAYKFQSTVSWTTAGGTTVNESITRWRNAASADSRTLKEILNFTYSGTPPAQGSTVSSTRVLQSYQ
jgi:hypothetical protein